MTCFYTVIHKQQKDNQAYAYVLCVILWFTYVWSNIQVWLTAAAFVPAPHSLLPLVQHSSDQR